MDNTTYTAPQEAPQTPEAAPPQSPPPPPVKRRRPGRRKKVIKNIIAATVALAAVAGLVWFTYSIFYSEPPEYYLTGAIEVWPEIKNEATGWGWLRPAESETLTITQQGNVLECNAWQGMMVNEGDVLAVIDSSAIDKVIENHSKQIMALEKDIENINGQIAKVYEQLQKANAEQIAMAKAARMYAPFTGRVTDVPRFTPGEIIYKGTAIGRLLDDSKMKLTLYFSYGYENDVYIGQNCDVSIPSAMATVAGKVTNIEKIRRIGSDGSVTFEVEITMDNPGSLISGSLATASMRTADGESVLPAEAGELECIREMVLTAESQGPLKELNIRNHYTYSEGALLMVLDFEPDTSIEEGYMAAIDGHRNNIEAKEEQIAVILESIDHEMEKMEDLIITAPISGTVTFTNLEWGMKITETVVATVNIAQLGTLTMEAWIGQSEIHIFSVGMDVDVLVWTQYGETWVKGSITEIDTSAKQDNQWAQYPVIISVDNSMGMMMDGSSANFSAKLAYSENAIVVPIQSVKNIGKGEYVFLKPQDGKAPENAVDLGDDVPPGFYAIAVKCGITNGRFIEITEGLLHEWEGWRVFTQKSDIEPSPEPSSHYEGENDDPNYKEGYDDGFEAGFEAGKSEGGGISDGMGDGGLDYWPDDHWPEDDGGKLDWPDDGGAAEDGYFDDEGNWIPLWPDGGFIDDGRSDGEDWDDREGVGEDGGLGEGGDDENWDGGISVMPMPEPMPVPPRIG